MQRCVGGIFLRGLRCGCGHTLQDRSDDRIEQGESHVVLGTGQALLLNCRTPQSYCTAPGQSPPAIPQKCAEAAGGHKVSKGS